MVISLFFPASLGLVWNVVYENSWSHRVLAFALFLMSLEQARMAQVDLDNIKIAKEKIQELETIRTFSSITLITIIIELLGFYFASFFLYQGAIIVLISLVFFNLFAKIQLHPKEEKIIESWGITQRLPILLADGLGLILVSLGMINFFPLFMSSILLSIILIYGTIKYKFKVQPQ